MVRNREGVALCALIALCTGTVPAQWREVPDAAGVRSFYNTADRACMARYATDGRTWYLEIQFVEGGCVQRIAHGLCRAGDTWQALRSDCERWPVFPPAAFSACCEALSRGERAPRLLDDSFD